MKTITKIGILAAALATSPLSAQQSGMAGMDHSQMQGMDHSKMMNDPSNPYGPAEMDMHQKMMAAKQGDASEMWTRKMIEHHRGAIAMSRVAVRDAKDAETKRMAQMTITKQEQDIAKLQGWLKSHGKQAQ